MGVLSVLVADPVACARLNDALGGAYRLIMHDSWSEFARSSGELDPSVLIVDIHHPRGPSSVEGLMALSHQGRFGVVVCSSFEGNENGLYQMGNAGVGGIILPHDTHNRSHVRIEVERALARAVARDVVDSLPVDTPQLARTAIRWAVKHATGQASVEGLSAEMGCSPGSLRTHLRHAGLPSPKRTLMWGRLFFAARELTRENPSVEHLAHRLGYASRSGLTRMMARELGAPPRALRRRDVWGEALDAYRAEIAP